MKKLAGENGDVFAKFVTLKNGEENEYCRVSHAGRVRRTRYIIRLSLSCGSKTENSAMQSFIVSASMCMVGRGYMSLKSKKIA